MGFLAPLLGGLGSIAYSMMVKLIGYEFITRTVVIGFRALAESTETKNDDHVVEAMAKAWGVEPKKLKEALK